MKKLFVTVLALLLLIPSVSGCSDIQRDDEISVVCTVFPIYDWTKNIIGEADGVELSLLVSNGTDLHSYQPTAADIIAVTDCDLLICLGGTSDAWIEEALAQNPSDTRRVIRLDEVQGVTLRHISQDSLASECEGDGCHDGHDHAHSETDEHLWLSLKNAQAAVRAISEELSALNEENSELYLANAEAYTEKLGALDGKYAELAESATSPYVLFADRFPFVYLMDDHGIGYTAAFSVCTTDTDASPDTIIRLASAANEKKLEYLIVTESSDRSLANSVIRATDSKDQDILVMDSMQSVTEGDIKSGTSYLSVMESNLSVLCTALGIEKS